jgi:CubicO group peptidase (beta-lactamase class C family)
MAIAPPVISAIEPAEAVIPHTLVREGVVLVSQDDEIDVPWWSFTKTVLAAAALVLVRDGKLRLDQPLPRRPYTLRQLLQHRAAVGNYGELPTYHLAVERNEDAWPASEMLARCNADRPLYAPGSGWAYSNIGYFHVRQLIEQTSGNGLDTALGHLVLFPLGIAGVRLAQQRQDFAGRYDPNWVYHGLLMGPLRQAALLLQRLLTGELLPQPLRSAMLDRYPVGGPIAGRPWKTPSYGLGLMNGGITGGALIAGHTGGGPGSVIAVYHRLDATGAITAAAFEAGGREGTVETACASLLEPS